MWSGLAIRTARTVTWPRASRETTAGGTGDGGSPEGAADAVACACRAGAVTEASRNTDDNRVSNRSGVGIDERCYSL